MPTDHLKNSADQCGKRAFAGGLALALALAMLAVSARPARALLCGDGILDELLEECDDGNLLPGDCCSPLCQFEAAQSTCRASTGPCDPAEECTGSSDTCPPDVRTSDSDGDAICDDVDICPALPDVLPQLDDDSDGVGNLCDPCNNIGDAEILKAKLTLSKLGPPDGDDRMRLKGSAEIPPDPPIDCAARGFRLIIADGNGTALLDVTIPGGPQDPGGKTGWRRNGDGTLFDYRGGTDGPAGIRRITVKDREGHVRFAVVGRDGAYLPPVDAPVHVSVILDPPLAMVGQCAEVFFSADEFGPKCRFLNSNRRLVCR